MKIELGEPGLEVVMKNGQIDNLKDTHLVSQIEREREREREEEERERREREREREEREREREMETDRQTHRGGKWSKEDR